jgi:hypothetical protein
MTCMALLYFAGFTADVVEGSSYWAMSSSM